MEKMAKIHQSHLKLELKKYQLELARQRLTKAIHEKNQKEKDWEGFREIDRAIAEDRLTSYTWKKTWADPWGRLKLILIFVGLIAFVSFVVVTAAS